MSKNLKEQEVPTFEKYMNPVLEGLYKIGGSGTRKEIYDAATEIMGLSEDILSVPHVSGGVSKVEFRISWALTYLKKRDLVANSTRGVWSLVNPGKLSTVDAQEIKTSVRKQVLEQKKKKEKAAKIEEVEGEAEDIFDESIDWKNKVLTLIHAMHPDAFERLCQRLLRESDFTEVTVTGKSGDGGIDGTGVLRLNGLLSFQVLFQSKRYKGSIGPNLIRDFRGAMVGRADKGLFITSGTFTKEALKEATRDGAPVIDLVDGVQLAEKLKDLRLGINIKMIEEVIIDDGWFNNI